MWTGDKLRSMIEMLANSQGLYKRILSHWDAHDAWEEIAESLNHEDVAVGVLDLILFIEG